MNRFERKILFCSIVYPDEVAVLMVRMYKRAVEHF